MMAKRPESDTTERECFGCGSPIAGTPGNYYCGPCIATQEAEQGDELATFDAYHRWADQLGGVR